MRDKWALEEHLSTAENNRLWDDAGEAARNGKKYMDYVESHYETMEQGAAWFDSSLLCANDARKIGRDNARRLFASITEIPVPRQPLDSDSARIQSVTSQRGAG